MRFVLVLALLLRVATAHADEPAPAPDPDADAVVNAAPDGEDAELDSAANQATYDHERFTAVADAPRRTVRHGDVTLSGSEMYLAVGRPDLAAKYRSNQEKRLLLGGLAAVLVGFGTYYPFVGGTDCSMVFAHQQCVDADNDRFHGHLAIGLGSVALGAAIGAAALWWIDPDPVSEKKFGRLVEHANWKLRRHLGVVDVAVTPTLGAGSGGLLLTGSF